MSWIDVDAEKLKQAASGLHQAEGEVEALADYAKEADPDWWMWGVAGIVMAPIYFGVAEIFHSSIGDARDAVSGLATRLEDCADEHEGNDQAIAAELEKIGQELEGDGS
ncbi:type VII secretion target [Glycomyces arizonensis]|uniref:type VII secretion target n=1 Tax=Glycomyces arizonensis TaxID=256035 RepID=UPI00040C18E1|nr:type VII secretion target [Glycomyces arizonensis]